MFSLLAGNDTMSGREAKGSECSAEHSTKSVLSPCAKAFDSPDDVFSSIEGLLGRLERDKRVHCARCESNKSLHASTLRVVDSLHEGQHGHKSCVF